MICNQKISIKSERNAAWLSPTKRIKFSQLQSGLRRLSRGKNRVMQHGCLLCWSSLKSFITTQPMQWQKYPTRLRLRDILEISSRDGLGVMFWLGAYSFRHLPYESVYVSSGEIQIEIAHEAAWNQEILEIGVPIATSHRWGPWLWSSFLFRILRSCSLH